MNLDERLQKDLSTDIYCLVHNKIINLEQKIKNQQKEFINYLEDMLDNENDIFSVVRVKDVLSKYQEIIGVSHE